MLPVFPKANTILDEEWTKQVLAAKTEVFPHEMHPPVLPFVEGKRSDYQRHDRKIVPLEMKVSRVSTSVDTSDGRGMTLESFQAKARELGAGFGKQMWEILIGVIDEAVAETGNKLEINKGNLMQEDVLRMFDMVQLNFDEAGNTRQQFVLGPELAAEFKRRSEEWSNDAEFLQRLETVKQRKRREFDEREARRRLVD